MLSRKLNELISTKIHNALNSLGRKGQRRGGENGRVDPCSENEGQGDGDLNGQPRKPVQVFPVVDQPHDRQDQPPAQDPPQLIAVFQNPLRRQIDLTQKAFPQSLVSDQHLGGQLRTGQGDNNAANNSDATPQRSGLFMHLAGGGKIDQPDPRSDRASPRSRKARSGTKERCRPGRIEACHAAPVRAEMGSADLEKRIDPVCHKGPCGRK